MSTLVDQAERDAFIQNTRGSYSVVAPAGVGKTESIIRRIAHLALLSRIDPNFNLSQLVVVTYTKAAATEMQQRAQQRLIEERHPPEIMAQFNRGFFGTIHSFCGGIAREWGPRLGVPSDFEIETNPDALFVEFMRSDGDLTRFLPEAWSTDFKRLVDIWKVLETIRNPDGLRKSGAPPCEPGERPEVDLSPIMAAKLKRVSPKLAQYKEDLRAWQGRLKEADASYVGLPETYGNAGIDEAFHTAFGPLFEWVAQAALYWLFHVDQAYFEYRFRVGRLLFSDTVRIVNRLLENKAMSDLLYGKGYHVILDEAQDTDPEQFKMLLGLCGVYNADTGSCVVRDRQAFSRGRWCMVGDFQQSIYKSRADVSLYRKIHDTLIEEGLIEGLVFQVTFRCDENIVAWVNENIQPVFDRADPRGRVQFVPLHARNGADMGYVETLRIEPDAATDDSDECVAKQLAERFARIGVSGLGIEDWSQCAILCPRKAQLQILESAFLERGIEVQKLSDNRKYKDLPHYAWPVALIKIIADPEDSFEIASVLREIFGLADESIYRFVHEAPRFADSLADTESVLQVKSDIPLGGDVPDVLNYLVRLRSAFFESTVVDAISNLLDDMGMLVRLKITSTDVRTDAIVEALDQVKLEAIQAIEKYGTWSDVSEYLETVFLEQDLPSEEPKRGHIQFLTCHKSKGLQWDVVVLPFLARPISKPQDLYPSLLNLQNPSRTQFLVSSSDPGKAALAQRDAESTNELIRLLYVSVTRAKHRLILPDDRAIYKKTGRALSSFSDLLTVQNTHPLEGLDTLKPMSGAVIENEIRKDRDLVAESAEARITRVKAFEFPKRRLPSTLGHSAEDASRESQRSLIEREEVQPSISKQSGAAYGTWWHEAMEERWREHPVLSIAAFKRYPIWNACPDQARADNEFALLEQHRGIQSLVDDGFKAFCEVPFFWQDDGFTFDGYIDCVFRSFKTGAWVLIDWKTDAVDNPTDLSSLKERYQAQIKVYQRALSAIWKSEGKAYLYSTRAGNWIEI